MVPGVAAHAAHRLEGVSAIDRYLPVHAALAEHERALNADVEHPLMRALELPYPLLVGRLEAGEWSSSVPDRLRFEGRAPVRVGEDVAAARAGVEAAVAGACPQARLAWPGGQFASGETDPAHPFAALVRDALSAELGRDVALAGVPWGADMRLWTARGIPTVMAGTPGIELAHAVDERVRVDDLVTLARGRSCGSRRPLLRAAAERPALRGGPAASAGRTARGHEVGAHRLGGLAVRADVAHARAAPAQDLQLDRDGHAEGLAQRRAQRRRSGPGTAPRSRGGPARRRGSSRSTRRRRRTRARRSAPGRRPRDRARGRHRVGDAGARRAGRAEDDAPPERLSTQQTRRRPSKRAPERSTSRAGRPSVRPVSGARASMAERTSAPPGRRERGAPPAPAATVAAQPQRAAVRSSAAAPARLGLGRPAARPALARPAQRLAGRQARGDDRARRGADEGLDAAQVGARLVLDAGEHAGHPRLADDAAAGEDEHVGCDEGGTASP